MKKTIYTSIVSAICFVCLVSCTNHGEFRIEGTIDSALDGQKIVLQSPDETIPGSDTTVIENGRFSFRGKAYTKCMFQIVTYNIIEDQNRGIDRFFGPEPDRTLWRQTMVVLEAGKIKVDLTNNINKLGGTPLNDLWARYEAEYMNASTDSISAFVIENSTNAVGKEAFMNSHQRFSEREIQYILDNADPSFAADERMIMGVTGNRLARKTRMENEMRENSNNVKYTDFELETRDGSTKRISDYVGKSELLVIDFWATWCGPCIEAIPTMTEIYEAYKDKGVAMIGISLDEEQSRDYWRLVLDQPELDTPWPQLGYLKDMDSDLAKAYIVSDIPYCVIIDREGTIVKYVRFPDKTLAGELDALLAI